MYVVGGEVDVDGGVEPEDGEDEEVDEGDGGGGAGGGGGRLPSQPLPQHQNWGFSPAVVVTPAV